MLEPYEGKLSRTVLRRESGSNPADLADNIHTLSIGDRITLTTKLGTRNYSVTEVKKISELDSTDTEPTSENCITLFTCVRNQSEYRWCVRAVETA